MKIENIVYSKKFIERLGLLPKEIIEIAIEKEVIFRENPLHSFLRLRELRGKLRGLWSITITKNYRIIFTRMDDGDILFVSIGNHDIYGSL